MRIERAAYANRWRRIAPAAKGGFALCGFGAAFAAVSPTAALGVAALLALATLLGARVPFGLYLRVAAPALAFLGLSSLSLAFSLGFDSAGALTWHLAPDAASRVAAVGARSLGALAALLFLVLSTPLPDLIALLRRLRVPEVILELTVLSYRMLFVFSEALHDTLTAQSARLGYATPRRGLHSLGVLTASLALQIWWRARALHQAALARNGEGPLRFLAPSFAHAGRDTALALGAGLLLIGLARSLA